MWYNLTEKFGIYVLIISLKKTDIFFNLSERNYKNVGYTLF